MSPFSITFVTRAGCHLCEEAEPIVGTVAGSLGVDLEVVDMDSDDQLVRLYSLRIPVVLGPDGTVLAEGNIDRRALRKALKSARRR